MRDLRMRGGRPRARSRRATATIRTITTTTHGHSHDHGHDHAHGHDRTRPPRESRIRRLEQAILAKNDQLAARNRGWLEGRGVTALNLMSAPGSGKTTLLERTIRDLRGEVALCVIEGDQATSRDADPDPRGGLRRGADQHGRGLPSRGGRTRARSAELDPPRGALVFVRETWATSCVPALFDLGERARVVVASVTEGEDKPIKYPHMFAACDALVLNGSSRPSGEPSSPARPMNPRCGCVGVGQRARDPRDRCVWVATGVASARAGAALRRSAAGLLLVWLGVDLLRERGGAARAARHSRGGSPRASWLTRGRDRWAGRNIRSADDRCAARWPSDRCTGSADRHCSGLLAARRCSFRRSPTRRCCSGHRGTALSRRSASLRSRAFALRSGTSSCIAATAGIRSRSTDRFARCWIDPSVATELGR